jgi:Ca2+-binding RTX toxin-like protein
VGSEGNDVAFGDDCTAQDADSMDGGDGNDTLVGGYGRDTLNGGNDADLLFGDDNDDVLTGGGDADTLVGGQGRDLLNGDGGDDCLFGGDSKDTLYGGDQNDILCGGEENDVLYGGNQSDTLNGAEGDDTLWGGTGAGDDGAADVFVYEVSRWACDKGDEKVFGGGGNDWIMDFQKGQPGLGGDKLVLRVADEVADPARVKMIGTDLGVVFAVDVDGDGWNLLDGDDSFLMVKGITKADIDSGAAVLQWDIPECHTLTAFDTGWYSQNGFHFPALEAYTTGDTALYGPELRSFFAFDLAPVSQNDITAATLRIYNPLYGSVDPSETVRFSEVSTSITSLLNGTGGVAAFNDLKDAAPGYGQVTVSAADNLSWVDVELNDAGLAALNAALGEMAIGGAVTTLSAAQFWPELVFLGSELSCKDVELKLQFADCLQLPECDVPDRPYAPPVCEPEYAGKAINDTSSDDNLVGTKGDDTIRIDGGDDTVHAGSGDDLVYGGTTEGEGDDLIYGEAGNDTLYGGTGNDRFFGGAGDDLMEGGTGFDVLDYSGAGAAMTVDLYAGTASGDGADSLLSFERLVGSAFDDTLIGGPADNTIWGGAGNDLIYGGGGNDQLYGQDGDDTIYGQGGDDSLYGGPGDDILIGGQGNDIIDLVPEGFRLAL